MSDFGLLSTEAWPWLLVAPLLVVVLSLLAARRGRRLREALGERSTATILDRPRALRRRVLCGAAVLFAAVSLLRPAWGEAEVAVEQRGVDLVLCLDVSRSMAVRDQQPDRARAALREIQELASQAAGDRLALVLFAGSARLAVPLTRDLASVATVAERAGPHSVVDGGTDLGAALRRAARSLGDARGHHEAVVLLTDGEDHDGEGLVVAGRLAEQGIRVHCVGFGSPSGGKIPVTDEDGGEHFLVDDDGREVVSRMDVDSLRRLAESTGGVFVRAVEDQGLTEVYRSQVRPMARKAFEEESRRERPERFRWALALALALGILELCLLPPVLR